MSEIVFSTPKFDLARELAEYSYKEQREILRAARHLDKFYELTEEKIYLKMLKKVMRCLMS